MLTYRKADHECLSDSGYLLSSYLPSPVKGIQMITANVFRTHYHSLPASIYMSTMSSFVTE